MASFSDKYGGYCVCTRDKCSNDCATYRRFNPKPVTNYDRIISKTPEELSRWIWAVQSGINHEDIVSTDGWLNWLKKEVEPDDPD